jgi:outer membrane protein OmpA-like peptidoglycan-associated protein
VNNKNQSTDELAAIDQLRGKIDTLSEALRNTQQGTRNIGRESTPYVGNQLPSQANNEVIDLERRMKLLSDEVKTALSNKTTQDSITLLYLENAKKTEADLNKKIDTLSSQLLAASLKEESMKQAKVSAERDFLKNKVKHLQDSLETFKSKKPDTVEREVITISELPKTEVFFKVNSSVLSDNDKQRIRDVASIVLKYPQVQVIIRGFTDKTGSVEYNLMLSKKRAGAVEQVLILSNVSANRIVTESNGVDNDLRKKASQYGRRVEIILSTTK